MGDGPFSWDGPLRRLTATPPLKGEAFGPSFLSRMKVQPSGGKLLPPLQGEGDRRSGGGVSGRRGHAIQSRIRPRCLLSEAILSRVGAIWARPTVRSAGSSKRARRAL